jgi:hypothetical protein
VVRRVAECQMTADADRVAITSVGCIEAPLAAQDAMQYIGNAAASFAVSSLPDSLDADSKRVLVSRVWLARRTKKRE